MTLLDTDNAELLQAINSATGYTTVLNAIRDHSEDAFGANDAAKANYQILPEGAGRQQAVANGLIEIVKFFGEFTLETLQAALKYQVEVEYAKHLFINAINGATAETVAGIISDHVEVLNGHRQELIDRWGAIENNDLVSARVAELREENYTMVLAQISGRFGDAAFMAELGSELLSIRDDEWGGRFNGVIPLTEALHFAQDEADFTLLLAAFKDAGTTQGVLDVIDNYQNILLPGTVGEHFRELPDNAGRQQAVALGAKEIARLFGEFDTVLSLKTAITYHIGVEYAKHQFIQALDAAKTPEEMSAAILAHLHVVNKNRQDLISEWSDVAGNAAVSARVEELRNDSYTTVLAGIVERLGNDPAFIGTLAQQLLTSRDALPGDQFFGVGNIVFALHVANNAVPTAPAINNVSTDEDVALVGVAIGAADSDRDTLVYAIKAGAEPQKGVVTLADGKFSYTPTANFNGTDSFIITISDGFGGVIEQVVNVTIKAVNDAPTNVTLSNVSVAENTKTGTVIGDLAGTDVDQGETFSFELLNNAGGRFAIQGNKLVVANSALLDYEQSSTHSVIVRVKDSGGAIFDKTFAIGLTDVANEVAMGTTGADVLIGGSGKDKLVGGAGKDILTGGKGKDTFVFNTKPDKRTNIDKVTDFSVRDDSIWLDNAVFKKLGRKGTESKPAQISKDFFTIGSKALDANDYLIYNKNTGALFYDADGSGRGAAIQIATLNKKLAMTFKDFFVV